MTGGAAYAPAAPAFSRPPDDVARRDSEGFLERMRRRRSVRHFSPDPVAPELIENAVRTAGTAPSGANQQPWSFVVIGTDAVKSHITDAPYLIVVFEQLWDLGADGTKHKLGAPPRMAHVEVALPAKTSARPGFCGSCQRKNSCVSTLNSLSSFGLAALAPEMS